MFRETAGSLPRKKHKRIPSCLKGISLPSVPFLLVMLLCTQNVGAQSPDTLWTRTFGGSNIDVGYAVQQTTGGGYIIAGYTRSYGSMSGRNVWLIKTDLSGNQEWNNAFGGNNDDEGYSVQQTRDGGYVIAGYTKSSGAGASDVLLIKTDTSGNTEWSRTFGGTQDDEGYCVQQTTDGGYIIAGATSSFGAGSRDVWLVKTNASGIESWRRTLGGFGSDGARSVQQTSDGGYVITGWTYSYGPGSVGNVWLVKTDTSGNAVWNRAFGGTDVDRGYCVQQTNDRGYVITGYTSSSGAGLDDMLLIKTDSMGNAEWTRTFGGTGRDYGNAVQQTTDGGYIIAGYTLSFGSGGDDVWLVKVDMNGNQTWGATYGGSASDVAYAVKQTSDGGYIVVGHTLSYGAGVHDVWLIRIAPDATAIAEAHGTASEYSLAQNYPNPFNPSTTIRYALPHKSFVTLTVYNALGQQVAQLANEQQRAGYHNVVFRGDGLASGVYFYRLSVSPTARRDLVVPTDSRDGQAGDFVASKKLLLLK
jgi:hypothetical protein